MVLIVPTTGCIRVDLKNIARQMINIEQNTHLFSSTIKPATCQCVKNDEIVKHNKHEVNENAFDKIEDSTEKFHVYELPNPIDPEHPITVETFSMVGNVVLYVPKPVLGHELEQTIEKILLGECNQALLSIYQDYNSECKTNGVQFLDMNYNLATRYTLISKPIDIDIMREINYYSPMKAAYRKSASSADIFVWNVYVIYGSAFSLYDYFNHDMQSKGLSRNQFIDSYIIKKNRYNPQNQKLNAEIQKFIYCMNTHIDMKQEPFVGKSAMIYAPNTILLDGAGLFTNKEVVKQLELPKFTEFDFPRFINLKFNYNFDKQDSDFNVLITNQYQKDHQIKSKFKHSVRLYRQGLNMPHNIISTVSWVPDSKNVKTPQQLVYYLHNLNTDIAIDLSLNYDNLVNTCINATKEIKAAKISLLNKAENKCYITDLPLWDNYFEIQFICTAKVSTKMAYKVVVCMQLSQYGYQLLCNAPIFAASQIHDKYFKNNKLLDYLVYLLNVKNIYKAELFNVIIKESKTTRHDIIHKLADPNIVKLLDTINKYGCVYYQTNIFATNPITNDVFMGVPDADLTDTLIMHMRFKSNTYIFPIVV